MFLEKMLVCMDGKGNWTHAGLLAVITSREKYIDIKIKVHNFTRLLPDRFRSQMFIDEVNRIDFV